MKFVLNYPENLTAAIGSYLPVRESIEEAIKILDMTLNLMDYPNDPEDEITIMVSDEIMFHRDGTRIDGRGSGDAITLYLSSQPWTVSRIFETLLISLDFD
ncbi:MAG: hypothetical protein M0P20_05645 [Methanocorpusculum sp.]|nr:hypothetical protein [Methanocorpusculum sp.]